MKGSNLNQALLGRQLKSKDGHRDKDIDPLAVGYWGLQEPVTIVAVWVEDGNLKVQVEDAKGRTHALYLSNFQLIPRQDEDFTPLQAFKLSQP